MKKLTAILMTLCMLFAALTAFADMEIPTFDSMPDVVMEDDNTTVEESAFEGEWVLNVAFLEDEYIGIEDLIDRFHFNTMPFVIADGKVMQDIQNEYGEFNTFESAYTFENGQLQGDDGNGTRYVFELLEDGNIVMTVFLPGEGDAVQSLSLFLQHPVEMK